MIVLFVLLLVLLIFLAAFFSASEVSLFSLSSIKVKGLKNHSDARFRLVAKLLASPRDLLVTVLMLNIFINILIQNVASGLFGTLSGWALNIGVPLGLTLVFGDVLPKSVGLAHNMSIAYLVAPILAPVQRALLPVRKVLIAITEVVSRVLFFFLKKEEEISCEEMQHALKTSKHQGVLNEDEAELIRGYLLLQETQVKEQMRPREEMLFYDVEEPLSRLVHLFVDQQCSRVPVCQGSLDAVLGIMTGQSYFLNRDKLQTAADLSAFLKKPFFVHEGMGAETLLRQMYDRRESIALVVDEYGSISGLIALEDLVEKVIGEIADARDAPSQFTRSSENVIIASGKMELSQLEELFSVTLPSENHMVTVGGWLTEQIGDIPKSGSKYTLHGFFFHVLSSDLKRVRRVYIRKLKEST
jgi:CBS domain containing-hemolysin-like protein